jgi:hypothetical protein
MTDNDTPLGACGTTWFYYQFFLASESEREGMKRRWGSGSIWGWEFRPWRWSWWTVSLLIIILVRFKVDADWFLDLL